MVYVAVIVILVLFILAVIGSVLMWTNCCFACKEERACKKKAKFVSSNHKRHSADDVTEEASPDDKGVDYMFDGVTCETPNHVDHRTEHHKDNHVAHIDEPDKPTPHMDEITSGGNNTHAETGANAGVGSD